MAEFAGDVVVSPHELTADHDADAMTIGHIEITRLPRPRCRGSTRAAPTRTPCRNSRSQPAGRSPRLSRLSTRDRASPDLAPRAPGRSRRPPCPARPRRRLRTGQGRRAPPGSP
jgi:hypothetical protein